LNSSEILGGQKSNAGSVSSRFYIIPLLSPFPPWVNIHLPPYDIPDQAAHLHVMLFFISTPTCNLKREKQSFVYFSFQSFQRFSRKLDQKTMPLEDTQTL